MSVTFSVYLPWLRWIKQDLWEWGVYVLYITDISGPACFWHWSCPKSAWHLLGDWLLHLPSSNPELLRGSRQTFVYFVCDCKDVWISFINHHYIKWQKCTFCFTWTDIISHISHCSHTLCLRRVFKVQIVHDPWPLFWYVFVTIGL